MFRQQAGFFSPNGSATPPPTREKTAGVVSKQKTSEQGMEKKVELDYSAFQTFVIAPTRTDYEKANKSDLEKKFAEEISMCKRDLQFLHYIKAPSVCPAIIFTGYHGSIENTVPFNEFLASIAKIPPEIPISLCFTSHGTPGNKGQFGFGTLDEGHFNYRMDVDYLITLLMENGFEQLKNRCINFQFRCCNSGYACISRYESSNEVKAANIKEQSLIGYFWMRMQQLFPENSFNVEGFRGFYYPEEKAVYLRRIKGGSYKDQVTSADGTIKINAQGEVVIPAKAISVIQNKDLDDFTKENRFSTVVKQPDSLVRLGF